MRAGRKADRNTNGVILDAIVAVMRRNGWTEVARYCRDAFQMFGSDWREAQSREILPISLFLVTLRSSLINSNLQQRHLRYSLRFTITVWSAGSRMGLELIRNADKCRFML